LTCAPPEVPDGRTVVVRAADAPGEVTRVLAAHGIYLEELTPVTADLETAFLALTGEAS
jgi:ABC-2 type transport system ATP-binding protein